MISSAVRQIKSFDVRPQPFDAEFVGGQVWRVEITRDCDRHDLGLLVTRARKDDVRMIVAQAPSEATEICSSLRATGFRLVTQLVTYERPISPAPAMPECCAAVTASEFEALVEIGRTAFRFDRFHADPRIPRAAADAFKARWVANGINGRADAAISAHDHGEPCGFVLCLLRNDLAVIDLIAVSADAQRCGYGRMLVDAALAHYDGRASRMRVGTQAENRASVALYERSGFLPVDRCSTFHWMPDA